MFELTLEPIISSSPVHEGAGGFVSFEGKVRNHANGRRVIRLEYEAYPEMAQTEGESLIVEAIDRFGLLNVTVIHRVGVLEIGETAVLIQTAAPHRREAFAGCEWIIDQLKFRVPIWKKETYVDGDSGWVGADVFTPNEKLEEEYFQRQVNLGEIGSSGQEKLKKARVLLVGVGGLGAASLPYLVAAGVGTLGLVDFDQVELSNLHRQIIFEAQDVGRSKVERAATFATRLQPGVKIESHPAALTASNVDSLVNSYDWIVDGTDSLSVKFLLNAACRRHAKVLISASIHKFEGHLLTVTPDGPCLNCLYPEIPKDHCVDSCAETGVLGVTPGLLGILEANEVLKGILGYGGLLSHDLLLVDLRTSETRRLQRSIIAGCPGCQGKYNQANRDFEFNSISDAHQELGTFEIIDIRELDEDPTLTLPHRRIPLSHFEITSISGPVLVVCATGTRSGQYVSYLRSQGVEEVFSLNGGIKGLSDDA
ncbi:MAG: ThiF family adenylyltransferase [Armatimonadota bacterium]